MCSRDEPYALLEPEADASSSRPVVVLCGWVGAQRDGPLLRYAQLLQQHGYTSVRSVMPLATAFSPLEGGRRRWALALLAFLQHRRLWPHRALVLYAFSNGGAFVVEQLQELAGSDPRFSALPATVAGFIFDSAPVYLWPGALAKVLSSVQVSAAQRWALLATNAAKRRIERALGTDRGAQFWGRMQRLSWGRPLLYLHSADDPLCDGAKVAELVEDKQRRGHDVRSRCWAQSEHVAHLRHHRAEYTALLLSFLSDAAAAHEGGCGGSTTGGGALGDAALAATAEAAAQQPRSRL